MYHYTYIIEGMGKKYIGVRSCKCFPNEDTNYMGSSKPLNEAIQGHGKDKFTKNILAVFSTRIHAAEHEIRLHEHFDVGRSPLFWNRAKHTSTGFSTAGVELSEETRRKISEANKYHAVSKETKRKIGEAKKGKTLSEEHRQKISITNTNPSDETRQRMSKSHTGKTLSKEHRHKISLTNTGHIVSEETKLKISKAKKGKNNPNFGKRFSKETKRKMSEAQKGKYHSRESIQRMSKAKKGKNNPMYGQIHSLETRRKIGETKTAKVNKEAKQKIMQLNNLRSLF